MDADITTTGAVIDLHKIQKMIPHRYPMLMIERVIDVVPGVRGIGIKNVSINEWFFQGHFPAEPLMPGVLIIEAMAQTAAVLVVATLGPEKEGRLVYFMSVDWRGFASRSCRATPFIFLSRSSDTGVRSGASVAAPRWTA